MNSPSPANQLHDPQPPPASHLRNLPSEILAEIIEQGVECTKISIEGAILSMTPRATQAFDLDNDGTKSPRWADIWPLEERPVAESARLRASLGETSTFQAKRQGHNGITRWFEGVMFPILEDTGQVRCIVAVTRDVTSTEIARQELDIKISEMRHRLRNTFSMIGSLVTSFAKGSPDREGFATEMLERLSAMENTQMLMVNPDKALPQIGALVPAIAEAFDTRNCPIEIRDESGITLDQSRADAISLVLGELAVNSDKHGALGSKGTISIDVQRVGDHIEIVWSERGNRLVESRSRPGGQGLRLMDRVSRSIHGDFEIDWKANGLDARMTLPVPVS